MNDAAVTDSDTQASAEPLSNAFLPNGRTSLPDIWRMLHSNAQLEFELAAGDPKGLRAMLEKANNDLLALLKSCPIERWVWICEGAGWTQTAAAAVSWCQEVKETHLVKAWSRTGAPVAPTPLFVQSANLVHSDFVEKATTLSALMTQTVDRPLAFALACVRARGALRNDLPANRSTLPQSTAGFADIACGANRA